MTKNIEHGNRTCFRTRALVEASFRRTEGPHGTVHPHHRPVARGRIKIGVGNFAYNLKRFVWWQGRSVTA
ncbi:hypothetical protein [Mesorhizobium sp. M0643]|uniref:hypothetical protein n=1 Tax=unclassified Mesorhizobium TaxID=325217 RepID=UPI00333640E5